VVGGGNQIIRSSLEASKQGCETRKMRCELLGLKLPTRGLARMVMGLQSWITLAIRGLAKGGEGGELERGPLGPWRKGEALNILYKKWPIIGKKGFWKELAKQTIMA